MSKLESAELGKEVNYDSHYNADKLFPVSRESKRKEIAIDKNLAFFGCDIWNHYEVSWLNDKGKPVVALAEIILDCESPNIIESKSMKLYFNSLNNSQFKDVMTLQNTIRKDLEGKSTFTCRSQTYTDCANRKKIISARI